MVMIRIPTRALKYLKHRSTWSSFEFFAPSLTAPLSVANSATRVGQNCATIHVYFSVILIGNSMMCFQKQVNACI
jgi:hypothetical protein